MATKRETVDAVLGLLSPLDVRARAMFGEYGVYCDDKFIGMVCDDVFFLKPVVADPRLDDVVMAPAYPGSKDYCRFDVDELCARPWLRDVVQATADALPERKPKR